MAYSFRESQSIMGRRGKGEQFAPSQQDMQQSLVHVCRAGNSERQKELGLGCTPKVHTCPPPSTIQTSLPKGSTPSCNSGVSLGLRPQEHEGCFRSNLKQALACKVPGSVCWLVLCQLDTLELFEKREPQLRKYFHKICCKAFS